MGLASHRAGALLKFMSRGKQEWKRLDDPYDQVIFPKDDNVAPGRPNYSEYDFNTDHSLGKKLSKELIQRIDPGNTDLLKQCEVWMELATTINVGFTHLGMSRVTPPFLHFLLSKKVDELYKLASYSVRDVQYAIFNCGYSIKDLLKDCPKAPEGNEPDPVLRRLKAVLNHPIGDYAVQVCVFYHALLFCSCLGSKIRSSLLLLNFFAPFAFASCSHGLQLSLLRG